MLVCGPCALAAFQLKLQLEAVVQRSQPRSGCGQDWGPEGAFFGCQEMLMALEACSAELQQYVRSCWVF